jgi:6,7-dimethyl-8-ribityllumazine synthase
MVRLWTVDGAEVVLWKEDPMAKTIQGTLDAKGIRFALVIGRFNSFIGERLLAGALDAFARSGASTDDITVVWVPGSFEIPLAAKKLAMSNGHDAVLCLGAMMRGDTPHFDYLASTVTKELATIALESGIPVIHGILTCDTMEQAVERAGLKSGNRGFDAAMTAIEMVQVLKQI